MAPCYTPHNSRARTAGGRHQISLHPQVYCSSMIAWSGAEKNQWPGRREHAPEHSGKKVLEHKGGRVGGPAAVVLHHDHADLQCAACAIAIADSTLVYQTILAANPFGPAPHRHKHKHTASPGRKVRSWYMQRPFSRPGKDPSNSLNRPNPAPLWDISPAASKRPVHRRPPMST